MIKLQHIWDHFIVFIKLSEAINSEATKFNDLRSPRAGRRCRSHLQVKLIFSSLPLSLSLSVPLCAQSYLISTQILIHYYLLDPHHHPSTSPPSRYSFERPPYLRGLIRIESLLVWNCQLSPQAWKTLACISNTHLPPPLSHFAL